MERSQGRYPLVRAAEKEPGMRADRLFVDGGGGGLDLSIDYTRQSVNKRAFLTCPESSSPLSRASEGGQIGDLSLSYGLLAKLHLSQTFSCVTCLFLFLSIPGFSLQKACNFHAIRTKPIALTSSTIIFVGHSTLFFRKDDKGLPTYTV